MEIMIYSLHWHPAQSKKMELCVTIGFYDGFDDGCEKERMRGALCGALLVKVTEMIRLLIAK